MGLTERLEEGYGMIEQDEDIDDVTIVSGNICSIYDFEERHEIERQDGEPISLEEWSQEVFRNLEILPNMVVI